MARDTSDGPHPAGRRLLYWLAKAAAEARRESNVKAEHVAILADLSVDSVRRFERAETWPQNPDELMAAYAELIGIEDPRDLYQRALDLWYAHGSRPLAGRREDDASPDDPQRMIVEAVRAQVARGRSQDRTARGAASTTSRKRRATP